MRILALLLTILLAAPLRAQERTVAARIVDAETGEPLPFAKIYVSPEKGTMTNDEGDFMLTAAPADTLRITFIGYEGQNLLARELPPVIRLQRLAFTMTEVTVIPNLMERIHERLNRIYKKNRKRKSRYFMRQTNVLASGPQMVEGYIEARAAVNLRGITFLSGRHFKEGKKTGHDFEGSDEMDRAAMLQFSNTHLLLNLGPLIMEEEVWMEQIITPFNFLPWGMSRLSVGQKFSERGYDGHYSVRVGVLVEAGGRELLRVELDGTSPREDYPQLCGVLHVVAQTLNPLSFDGFLKGHQVGINNSGEVPARTEVHIRYDDDKERPLISQITATIKAPGVECRTLLFRTDRKKLSSRKSDKEMRNMLEAIRQVGYDPELWKDPIVKHTLEEERLMTGQSR